MTARIEAQPVARDARHADLQAEALLVAIVERAGGDLRAAFAILCASVSLDDLLSETFEAALARAVRDHFGWPEVAPLPYRDPEAL